MNPDALGNALTDLTDVLAPLTRAMSDIIASRSVPGTDGDNGLLMPALAGMAAAITVALAVALYFQTDFSGFRATIRRSITAAIGLSLLAFAAYDMRNHALAYLEKATVRPATEFEQRWQKTTERAKTLTAEMDRSRVSPDAHQG